MNRNDWGFAWALLRSILVRLTGRSSVPTRHVDVSRQLAIFGGPFDGGTAPSHQSAFRWIARRPSKPGREDLGTFGEAGAGRHLYQRTTGGWGFVGNRIRRCGCGNFNVVPLDAVGQQRCALCGEAMEAV